MNQSMTCPPLAPPPGSFGPGARRFVDATLDTWTATVTGVAGYWSSALERGHTPFDVAGDAMRWWQEATDRRRPTWSTAHEIVRETPLTRLRDFTAGSRAGVVPTLVLPPQAGHDSCIVDYSVEQSQMQVIRAAGLERAFALDWVGATQATKDATVSDYLAEISATVEHIGGPVNVVGDCQGGWLATVYAALHPAQVNTLTIAGAPIDFHAGDAVIHDSLGALSPGEDMSFYRSLVALGGGVLKGELLLGGFVVIRPENEVAKQLQLLSNIDDEVHVRRFRAFEDWFKHTQDVAGPFYLWLVQHLFRDNELVRGELVIDGERVDLAAISCPVNLIAGGTDHITPPDQVFALERHVSTPRHQITKRTTSGGHLGLFMGTEALRDFWPPAMAAVLEHSRPGAEGARAERRARERTPRRRRAIPAP